MMDTIDVHPRIIEALKKAKLRDVGYILMLSPGDLQRFTRLSANDIVNLQAAIADSIPRPQCVTGLQLLNQQCPKVLQRVRLSSGCTVLNQFLRGGVLSSGITEIAGESASGKTQFCLQLCLTVQLPQHLGGLESGAVYISTEDVFPNRRLVQMASMLRRRHPNIWWSENCLTDKIFVEHAADMDATISCLSYKVRALLKADRVKLVIIDSVAGVFRGAVDEEQAMTSDYFTRRAKRLASLANLLHTLSAQFNIPVVVVNQVSDVFGQLKSDDDRPSSGKTPALGLSWANMVTTRLMLSRTSKTVTLPFNSSASDSTRNKTNASTVKKTYEATVRALEVVFSPHLPNGICHIILDEDGVKGVG